jgi:hypothetical protein
MVEISETRGYNRTCKDNEKCKAGTECTTTPPPAYGVTPSIRNGFHRAFANTIILLLLFFVQGREVSADA